MPKHKIIVSADVPGVDDGLRSFLRRVIRAALDAEGVDVPCEVNVLVTGDRGIHQINLDTRGVDAPTDVLSFPMLAFAEGEEPDTPTAGSWPIWRCTRYSTCWAMTIWTRGT